MMYLFGWPTDVWQRAYEWADVPFREFHQSKLAQDYHGPLSVREKWELAGGPQSGPSGKVLLSCD